MVPVYSDLNVAITLRCNARCLNCIRLCGDNGWSGLDYSGTDMTLDQIEHVIRDVEAIAMLTGVRPIIGALCVTGGEPSLHPALVEIWQAFSERLLSPGLIGELVCNANATRPLPGMIAAHLVHWWSVGDVKAQNHIAAFSDPALRGEGLTFANCGHYRKDRIVVTAQGFTRCCAAEGYVRLACAEDLILDHLPMPDGWPNQDRICEHCAFACQTQVMERDAGRPIDPWYQVQADLNLKGRRIARRLGA